MNTSQQKIPPCPYCGGEEVAFFISHDARTCAVRCPECLVTGPGIVIRHMYDLANHRFMKTVRKDALEKWGLFATGRRREDEDHPEGGHAERSLLAKGKNDNPKTGDVLGRSSNNNPLPAPSLEYALAAYYAVSSANRLDDGYYRVSFECHELEAVKDILRQNVETSHGQGD